MLNQFILKAKNCSKSIEKSIPKVEKQKLKIISLLSFNSIDNCYSSLFSIFKKKKFVIVSCEKWLLTLLILFSNELAAQPTDGKQNGYTYFYFSSGRVSSEGVMKNGSPEGYWKNYYEDGTLKSAGNRNAAGTDSVWVFYTLEGFLEKSVSFKDGNKQGFEKLFGKKGNLLEEYSYDNNKKTGSGRYYYETGELFKEVNFEEGKEEGRGYEFDKDGRILTILSYKQGFLRSIERINRLDNQGRRTGMWQDLHDNGRMREEGTWNEGKKNGLFKLYDRKGEFLRFERYLDDQLVMEDETSFVPEVHKEFYDSGELKMVGSYKEGSKQGVFREYDTEGNIISSAIYENNVKVGEGVIDAAGKRQGAWTIYFPTGEVRAKGTYVDGKREGDWTYFYKEGKTEQTGRYKNDLPEGSWKWYYASGKQWRDEQFRKGKEDGLMTEWSEEDEELAKGEFVDGLKNGPWFMEVGDHREEGEYVDGEKHGVWNWTLDKKEIIFTGEFNNGIPIGKHKFFHPNGKVKEEGKFKGGERHGDWRHYQEEGTILYTTHYAQGIITKIDGQRIEEN